MTDPTRHNYQPKSGTNRRCTTLHWASCDCGCSGHSRFVDTPEQARQEADRMQREDTSL